MFVIENAAWVYPVAYSIQRVAQVDAQSHFVNQLVSREVLAYSVFFRFIALDIGCLLHVDFLYVLLYADGDGGVAHVGRGVGFYGYVIDCLYGSAAFRGYFAPCFRTLESGWFIGCDTEFPATSRLFKMEGGRFYDDFQFFFIVRASCHQK